MNPTTVVAASALGLLLGCRHAFEPDHLAAVAAMVSDGRARGKRRPIRTAAFVGALWGLGHTLALVAVALVLAALRAQMPPTLTVALEVAVGVLLVGLGVHLVVRSDTRRETPHRHDHRSIELTPSMEVSPSIVRPLAVGLVHGLAGSGALVALVAASIDHPAARVAHVALFGIGSTVAMAAVSGVAGVPVAALASRPSLGRWLRLGAAALSATTGGIWIVTALSS